MKKIKLLFVVPLLSAGLFSCGSKTPSELSVIIKESASSTKTKDKFQIGEQISKDQIEVNAKFSDGSVTVPSDKWTSSFFNDKTTYTFVENDLGTKTIDVNYGGIKKDTKISVELNVKFGAHFVIDNKEIKEGESYSFTKDVEKTVKVVLDNQYKKDWVEKIEFEEMLQEGEQTVIEIKPGENDYEKKVKGITVTDPQDTRTFQAIFTLKHELEQKIYFDFSVIDGK